MSNKKYHLATISWTKVLGTVLQYSYFSVISRFPLKTVHPFRNFLAVLPPPSMPYACSHSFFGYWFHYMRINFFWKVLSPTMGPPSSCKNPQNSSLFSRTSRFSSSLSSLLLPLPKSVRFAREWWKHRTCPFWLFLEFVEFLQNYVHAKFRKNKVLTCVVFIETSIWSNKSWVYHFMHLCRVLYREYYTVARRYEFYVQVARTISHEWAQRTSEILLLPREHKIHIFELTCNILFIT